MTLLLESWGVTVLESASGEEALALFDEIGILPDAFLVDYHLGKGMTGLEFIEILRERHGPVHAALVTANRAQELDELCLAVGIPLMRKPLDTSKIEAFLQNVGEH
ncbi:hybrid sensor histidine kinase/response regulator, partial [Enterococcus faecium]